MITRPSNLGLSTLMTVLIAAFIVPLSLAAQVSTATALTLSDTSPVVAQTVTLLAQVSPVPPIPAQVTVPPTGFVTLTSGTVVLGTAAINGSGLAQLTVQLPAPGNYILDATYGGDANYAGSTAPAIPAVVALGFSSVSQIQVAPGNPVAGQNVALAVSVSSASRLQATPHGTVTFTDNGTILLGSAPMNGIGIAEVTASFLPGTHLIVANYSGDADFLGSSSPVLALTVHTAFTMSSLGASPSNAATGQAVTFTASVSPVGSGGIGSPTGSFTFMDGAAVVGTSPLAGVTATLATSALAAGLHVVTAIYSGDADFASSTSAPVAVTVSAAPTVGLSFSEGASGFMLTSTVASSGPTAPTGSVQFNDVAAGKTLATATLANGSASATVNSPPAGHTMQAVYSGDATNGPSSSALLTLAVLSAGFSSSFTSFAPDEFATIYGVSLAAYAGTSASGSATPVAFIDASGTTHSASILYMAAGQVNIVVPGDLPIGPATLTITTLGSSAPPIKVSIAITSVAPSLGPVGQLIRVHSNGLEESPVATAEFDTASQSWIPVAVPFPASTTDTLFLVLYGTGFRHAKGGTTCAANGQALTVQYSGAQGAFPGLDQINALVPAVLEPAGQVQLTCSVDGQTSNAMMLVFQ